MKSSKKAIFVAIAFLFSGLIVFLFTPTERRVLHDQNSEIKIEEEIARDAGSGTIYYVDSINGDDSNPGTSGTPWKTIRKVNSMTFKPGDSILFKRGGSWREYLDPQNGNSTDKITYGTYGTGPKPKFIGALLRNETIDWFDMGGNIWSTNSSKEVGSQLLSNPSFESGTSGWVFYNHTDTRAEGYQDTIRYDSGSASYGINCTTRSIYPYDISFRATDIIVIQGCLYNFSFRAKCTQPFNISAIDIMNYTGSDTIRLTSHTTNQTPTITTTWKTYHVLFRVDKSCTTGWIIFALGDVLPEGSIFNIDTCSFKMLQNDTLFYADIGNLIFNNEQECGLKVWNATDLDSQGEFWFDEDNWFVKMYSVDNPASVYSDGIEVCMGRHIIDEEGKHDIIYENLHLMYGGAHGIGGGNTYNITIRYCDFSYIGGSELPSTLYNNIRFGNAIEFWSNASDNLVEHCKIWEIYDAGITNQGTYSGNKQYNLIYNNNTIWNCEMSFEIWNNPANSIMHNIYIENNTCYDAGSGWGNSQRYDPKGTHLYLGWNTANTIDIFIRNNIFYEVNMSCLYIHNETWSQYALGNLTLDYNMYYSTAANYMIYYQNDLYLYDDFSQYQADTGKDAHSYAGPLPKVKNLEITPSNVYVGNKVTIQFEVDDIIGLKNVSIEIFGKNHTLKAYSGVYNYSWTANNSGTVNYKIHMEDLTGYNNSMSRSISVNIYIPPSGDDDDNDDDDEEAIIPFGNYYLLFAVLAMLSLIVIIKRKAIFKEL
ncbi:MAG: carbohydrate binding domain-containing protein [Candidatus Hodarchaeota archaeon]